MDDLDSYRNSIGTKLALAVASALKENKMSLDEYSDVGAEIVERLRDMSSVDEIREYLKDISERYPIFASVYLEEQKKTQQAKDEVERKQVTDELAHAQS